MMVIHRKTIYHAFICLTVSLSVAAYSQGAGRSESSRSAVEAFFSKLKSREYSSLYDYLPSQLQQQISREQLAQSLKRLEMFIKIERMTIGRVQEKADLAVIDTTIYGRLVNPTNISGREVTDGRVTVQQFLFKEAGKWKIATADNRTRSFFLNKHPDFQEQFQLKPPLFEFRDGKSWVTLDPTRRR